MQRREAVKRPFPAARRVGGGESMHDEIRIRQSFVVGLSREETYSFWRRIEGYPRFMEHVASVEPIDANRSRWVVAGPAGRTMTWETEIVEDEPGTALAWRTVGRADVRHDGRVELYDATADRGTVVCVRMTFESPAHHGHSALARVFRNDPETQVRGDLRRFRELAEGRESARGTTAQKDAEEKRTGAGLPARRARSG
ncbi:MAG TPA: SRPBCC family protein [Thermoanaerobaculia bacterium]